MSDRWLKVFMESFKLLFHAWRQHRQPSPWQRNAQARVAAEKRQAMAKRPGGGPAGPGRA